MVKFTPEEGKLLVTFPKKTDTAICTIFEPELTENLKGFEGKLEFDLTGVEYIASSFLRICLDTAKKIGKERFVLVNVPPFVQKVFTVSGFDTELNIS